MAVESKYFVDVFGAIVDTMRQTGTITASSEISTGVYTITTPNTLKEYWHVAIDSVDYEVTSVTETTFNIQAATGLNFTNESWKALEPYYMYGHYTEVSNQLSLKDKNPTLKFNKYPLVYLLTDIKQSHGEYKDIDYVLDPFTVLIITSTKPNYIASERLENTFKPILYPIYSDLIDSMKLNRMIAKTDADILHDHIDRYYWGSVGIQGNDGLIFNDHLDAIELTFNNIQIYKPSNVCQ